MKFNIVTLAVLLGTLAALHSGADDVAPQRVEFQRAFAPSEGMVADVEKPLREEICLNGSWQFQPMPVPAGFQRGSGTPPDLAQPAADKWEATPIKIPSPWNVNDWGTGPDSGVGTGRPYAADSVYYPSYPASWMKAEMGWMKRSFQVPADWSGKRIILHFEAVAGDAQVFVNGQLAGEHFDSFLPFDLDVTSLVKPGAANELLVGVRKSSLYNIQSPGYPPGQQRTYPNGSNMDNLVGIWNDVFLWALPAVRVDDVFIQPQVDQGTLRADVTLRNDTNQPQTVRVGATVAPWVNLAGTDTLSAPEPKWKLDAPVLSLPAATVTIPAGGTAQTTLSVAAGSALKLWSPSSPNLYGMITEIGPANGQALDRKYTRFGWRQFRIAGDKLLLNGQPIQLFSDFGHPFGPFVCSRRYVWQDYEMIKGMGGNSVRPHANVMPRLWLDLADEMGICVIDESSIFGSSIALNLKAPETWTRFQAHVDALVRRDRDHPSVFGWSVANEMFALFFKTDKADRDAEYAQLKALAQRPLALDPTRNWISMDGDQDLEGTLPVWSRHMGIGLPKDLPDSGKPRMIGEHGGTYYAAPPLLAPIGGDRAYESYAGRNEALARDLYRMITQVALPKLAYFSASEMVWFGLEQLPFGYHTDARLPDKTDGVFFPNYVENVPGVQIERLPPYVTTLNPGFDPALPPFKPLAMYEAMKAALDPRGPQPCAWDKLDPTAPRPQPAQTDALTKVAFVGDREGKLFSSLYALGVPLAAPAQATDAKVLVIDGETVNDSGAALAKPLADAILHNGGLVWVMLRDHGAGLAHLGALLPAPVTVTERTATLLDRGEPSPAIDGFATGDLYFVADKGDSQIEKAGLSGPLVRGGHVLLTASNTDWTLFQRQPEVAKCGAMLIYEHLKKPDGAALVEVPEGGGRLWVSTLDSVPTTPAFDKFWTQLWHNLGVKVTKPAPRGPGDTSGPAHDLLLDGPLQ
jgi:beta-galactosidase